MKLMVGLGNPGQKYANHRHNIGFLAIDALHARHTFSAWRKRFRGQTAEGRIGDERVLLLKPDTFMNESGRAVAEAARFLKIAPADTIVFHDELDLAPGKLRAKVGGGHAGHNGLRSIVAQYAQDFVRVRIGIGHPGHKDRVAGYVLNDFAKADNVWIVPMLDAISDNADALLREDLNAFQSAIGNAVAGTSSGDRSAASKSSAQSTGTAPQRLRKPDSSRAPGRKAPAASGRNVGDTTGRTRNRPSQTDLARRASGSGSGSSASKAPQHRPAKSEAAPPQSDAQTSTDATPSFAQRLANFFNSNDKSR